MLKTREAIGNLHTYKPPLANRVGLRLDFNESTIVCSPELLQHELRNFGIQLWPNHANFVLVSIGVAYVEFVQALRDRGILVRDRNSDPGREGCVRITVGSDELTEILISTLHDVVERLDLLTDLPRGMRA